MGWESAALLAWGGVIAVSDARTRRLPNALTLGAVAFAAGYLLLFQRAPADATAASALAAAAVALLVTVPAYVVRWLGGGDVKLAVAMALLGGTSIFVTTLVIGGLLLGAMLLPLWRYYIPTAKPLRTLPYGTAHGVGFMVAVTTVQWLPDIY